MDLQVDFVNLGDGDIATIGLDAAEAAFLRDVGVGLTNGDSLAIVVGHVDDFGWQELGRRLIGPEAEQFEVNVDAVTGKLATTLDSRMNSVLANFHRGDDVPEGPQRYTGGVFYAEHVKTAAEGWLHRDFAGAASGVQGYFDQATTYSALTRMGACWALKMQALLGKAD